MVNWKSRKLGDFLWLGVTLAALVLANMIAAVYFVRADLTAEKRYSIKDQTRELLSALDDEVYIEVFLEGELNAPFRRLRKNTEEILREFAVYSDGKVKFSFTDPGAAQGKSGRNEFMRNLASRGIQPTNVVDNQDGRRVEKIIFPGALVAYGGIETGVMLLKGSRTSGSEDRINQSIEGIEFELANAIYKLVNPDRKRIAITSGHGEPDSLRLAGFREAVSGFYDVLRADLSGNAPLNADVVVVVAPTKPFSAAEKYRLDQFIAGGGKAMFLLDRLRADMDSASRDDYFALPVDHGLDDLLFRYGVRINADLVHDQQSALYPVVTGEVQGKPQMQLLEWPFFPLINHYADHPITRNLDAVVLRFASSIDTVRATGVRKTPLMFTSPYVQRKGAPVHVSIDAIRREKPGEATDRLPVGYLLEGAFTSLYKNRFPPEGVDARNFRGDGLYSRIVVIGDGDLLKNAVHPRTLQPQPLGFDPYTNYTFANRDLVLNTLAYLAEDDGLIQARNKELKIRPLDRERVRAEKTRWQVINLLLPVLLMTVYAVARAFLRKRKYASYPSTGANQ